MKKVNKRKIIALIIIMLAVIFEIVAFRKSRATKIFDITAEVVDYDNVLENEEVILTAADEGNSGYYITLPEYIGTKKVDTYIVEEQKIHSEKAEQQIQEETTTGNDKKTENQEIQSLENNEVANQVNTEKNAINEENVINEKNGSNVINENNIEETKTEIENTEKRQNIEESQNTEEDENSVSKEQQEQTETKYLQPGQLLYLTETEADNKKINLKVQYSYYEKNDTSLYEQKITTQVDDDGDEIQDTTIQIEGFMPIGATVSGTKISIDEIQSTILESLSSKVSFKKAYDIKILYNEKEYEPADFDVNVKVTISGIDEIDTKNQKYKVLHIEDNTEEDDQSKGKVTEVNGVQTTNNSVIFPADSFSTYALLLEDGLNSVSAASLDLEDASVWDGSSADGFKFGDGSQENPYLIINAKEFSYLATQVSNGTSYDGSYFELVCDIDLNNNEWTPIGNYTNPFKGIFNGNGHTIANAKLSLPTSVPTSVSSYGIFGSIGDSTNKTIIKNLQLDNISVELNASGTTANNTTAKGYNIGIVTGTIYNNAEIKNVIVNNSSVMDNYTLTARTNSLQILVGGIAGTAVNSRTSTTDPGEEKRYSIENCYSNFNVELDGINKYTSYYSNTDYSYAFAQYNVGGIIGLIRGQAVWPKNCLYTGNLNAENGFTGPIFGAVRGSTGIGNSRSFQTQFDTLWQGNDAGDLTMESYYTAYSTNDRAFSDTVTSGTSSARVTTNINWNFDMGYVQGVNKGVYISSAQNMLSSFNEYVNNNETEKYLTWNYNSDTNTYYFIPELTATVEKDSPRYIINVNDLASTGNYTYTWYIDGEIDSSITGNIATINSSWTEGHEVLVLISSGRSYVVLEFDVPKWEIHVSFEMNNQTNVLTAGLEGTGTVDPNFNLNDYTYKWYAVDIAEAEQEIDGATTNQISDLENGMQYKVVATNTKYDYMSAEGIYTYGTRTVIYCSSSNGNDSNDGFTPNTPVKTMSTAYGKFSAETTRNENVIVLMGNYTDQNFMNSATSTTYRKNVTITGKYQGIDYNGVLYFEAYDNYRYLNGNTTFMHLIFKGCTVRTGWNGNVSDGSNSQTYFYLQGYSLTMGEGITMSNYATSNTNQGLIEGNAPAFHMFAGWMQFDETRLPRTGAEIVIKSGTYGRILLGGSSGTSGTSSITKYNSHNFIGTSLTDDLYKCKITIDIQNSTTSSNYTYDINLLGGGSTCGNIYGDIELNVKNGKVGRLLGASIGDSSYRPNNWQYPLNTFIGTTTINMSGGSVAEMYGGCLGRNMNAIGSSYSYGNVIECDSYFYGTVNINISGGTVSQTIYGAGAGGVSGYSENSTDEYKSYGQDIETVVNINITGGTIDADIYGGGYGYTNYLTASSTQTDGGTLYGNSNINISGSAVINGSIYGGGRGYDLASDKPNLAQMEGNSTITISGTPTITGNIYGAGMGLSDYEDMAKFTGNATINISADLTTNVFGGGNIAKTSGATYINVNDGNHSAAIYGGGNVGILEGTSNVTINGGTSSEIYGGGNQADVTNSNVFIKGGTNQSVYGGGNQAGAETTNIAISGGTTEIVYGGSNQSGTIDKTTINATGGIVTNVFGGNNEGGTCTLTNVTVDGSKIVEAVYGGGNQVATTTTNVYLISSDGAIASAFGGGKSADATTTNVFCKGATAIDVFGGSNTSGAVDTSNIEITDGNYTNIYGGNNLGGSNNQSYINVNGGTSENIYGGGNQVAIDTSNIEMNSGKVTNIYGGGNNAGATTTNVNINGGNLENAYGGANKSGEVTDSNVTLKTAETSQNKKGITMDVTYTAKAATWETTEYPTVVDVSVTYTNNTSTTINTWDSYIKSEGAKLFTNYSSSEIKENNGKFTLNQDDRYYGTHALAANATYTISFQIFSPMEASAFELEYQFLGNGADGNKYEDTNTGLRIFGGNNAGGTTVNSHINIESGIAYEVYGGNNKGGETTTSNVITTGGTVTTVYGGNNLGGTTKTANVTHNGGTITDLYGGGNQAVTTVTNVKVNANVENCVYGGGNAAGVDTDTNLDITGAVIGGNVYGGGNEGTVTGNTYLHIKDATLQDSVYAGGNGTTAIVFGNANVTVEGTNTSITNSVFGGGNQAATGTEANNNSISTVNIVGGTIGKNVYGGANTSVVYGYTKVNIGYDAVADDTLTIGDIEIDGTIFGGGEANASGSEEYDYSFISVTKGIDMNIDGNGHTKFQTKGSIFGSGNASSTSGYSYINIKNYGSAYSPQSNISIQRANRVTLDNSTIALSGATDRTNEYSKVYFTFSRIDELKLKNNSIVYLNCGANLLKKLTSCVDENGQEVKAKVTIDSDTGETTRNVDNRIYMAEGKNLNIATNEQVTAYGEVSGMTFFGLFTNTKNPSTSTGIYNKEYNNGDEITNAGTFVSNSYVLGLHKTDHDTTVDGFYSNFEEEDNKGYIKTKYIETTPEDDVYYIWLVGVEVDVTTFELTLTGSKYATLGTYELALTGFATANTKFVLSGFSAGLEEGISLINPANIENISADPDTANEVFGLSMKTGNNGWQTNSSTYFLTENGGSYVGTSEYDGDNSTYTPALNFCFYHSGNISKEQELGSVKVRFQALVPIDDLNYEISYIDINIMLLTALYQNDFFEAAITPGEEFSLFTTTETNITDSSNFSTYYSLYIPEFSESKYYDDYKQYHRVLVSRDSDNLPYVFPKKTKITMIDMVNNKYYYYVVTEADENSNKYVYKLSDFIAMGSDGSNFNEESACDSYYTENQDLIYENYIFHIDFSENIIPEEKTSNSLLIEMRDDEEQTLIGVLGIQRDTTVYSIYKNKDALIKVSASLADNVLYRGKSTTLTVTTDFKQEIVNSKTIYDTEYFGSKMGIKLSIYDNNGNRLNNDSLLGVYFELNGTKYYPRIDGTTRIKIADKVSNVLSKIKIDTSQNTTLATGDYTIKVESFGSADGIYYGVEPSDVVEVPITIINSNYGLKIYTDDKSKIVDKETGKNEYDSSALWLNVEYSSSLDNPQITICLYRRKYTEVYSNEYELVDLQDYVSSSLTNTKYEKEYLYSESPAAKSQKDYVLKENLKSGTYKIVCKLYDGESYIGEAYEYLIIK